MPRQNAPRDVYAEGNVARRVAVERERRGWTYEGLAKRMTDAGCSINASAIYKIEKADPPRRITVDELVGFSRVFDVPVDELLVTPELATSRAVVDALHAWWIAGDRRREAEKEEKTANELLQQLVADDPTAKAALHTCLDEAFQGDRRAVAGTLHMLGDDDEMEVLFEELWQTRLAQRSPEDRAALEHYRQQVEAQDEARAERSRG